MLQYSYVSECLLTEGTPKQSKKAPKHNLRKDREIENIRLSAEFR